MMTTAYRAQDGDIVVRLRFMCEHGHHVEAAAVLAAAVPVDVLRAAELMQLGAARPADEAPDAVTGAG